MTNITPIRVAKSLGKFTAEERADVDIIIDEINFQENLLIQQNKQSEVDEPTGELKKLYTLKIKLEDSVYKMQQKAEKLSARIEDQNYKSPTDIAKLAETQRLAHKLLKADAVSDTWKCDRFDISNPIEFLINYCNSHNIIIAPKNKIYRKGNEVDSVQLINELKCEQSTLDLRSYISQTVIPCAVEKVLYDVTFTAKKDFIKSFANPSADKQIKGYEEFIRLAEAWLGKDAPRRLNRTVDMDDGYEMELCALYTFLAQAKYKIIHNHRPLNMRSFSIHAYSPIKGLGKSYPMEQLFDINGLKGIGLFTSPADTKSIFNDKAYGLMTQNNILMLDDFNTIPEDDMEAWKRLITTGAFSARPLYTNTSILFSVAIAIITIGNSDFGDKVYNENKERRTIQLYIDGIIPEGSLTLDSKIFEHLDYQSIWDGIDESKYNLVWEMFPDEVKESQEAQTSETWYDDWVQWMASNETTTNGEITSISNFIEEYYIKDYCNPLTPNGQVRFRRKQHDAKTVKKRLRQDPTFSGYGKIIHNKVQRRWSIEFDFESPNGKYKNEI